MASTETIQFTIGAEARCTDGDCGQVSRVVVDPVARELTHLVVEPKHRRGLGRLVPLNLVESANAEILLRCTSAEFEKLDAAEETHFLPASNGYAGYESGQVFYQPYYGLGLGMGGMGMAGVGLGNASQAVTTDTVPAGEVAVRRGQQVRATDGDLGKVQGLVIDPRSRHVTHVLLNEGHLWGHKEVAIPIRAVARIDDGIRLNISAQEVQDLPPVEIEHPGW